VKARWKELESWMQTAEQSPLRAFSSQSPLREYTYEELAVATGSFAAENVLGSGGFGTVYRAVIDHTDAAVKVLAEDGLQGRAEFQREVEVHCRIRHPHIAMLLGTCLERRMCLVYDLMPNGNLADRLMRIGGSPALTWQSRVRIASEVAIALLYLHSARPAPIIHR
jgi:serine/threonine protein kinase